MGFASPATDYVECKISLDEKCNTQRPAIYMFRAEHALSNEYIAPGAVLIVDSSAFPLHGNLIIASVDGQHILKRVRSSNGTITLESPDNPDSDIILEDGAFFGDRTVCFGVITHILNDARRG